jgi:hypothetical protein
MCWWVAWVHSEKENENPLPGREVDHTVLDVNNGSLHAQRNGHFMLFFTKRISL